MPNKYYDRTQRIHEYIHVRTGKTVKARGTLDAMDKLGVKHSQRWLIVRSDFVRD